MAFSVINYGQHNHFCLSMSVVVVIERLENFNIVSGLIKSSTGLLSYKQPQLGLVLASNISIRRKRGLPSLDINYSRYDHHFCSVSVVEVLETLEN